jgi:hypothetical protein
METWMLVDNYSVVSYAGISSQIVLDAINEFIDVILVHFVLALQL